MKELQKYIIEGQIQDELIKEMSEPVNTEENYYMTYKANKLVENVLREFEMAVNGPTQPDNDPYKDVDPKVKKSQQLVRVLQDSLYKLQDSQKAPYPGEEVDDDIKGILTSNLEPTIKAVVNKLHSIWFGAAEEKTEVEVEIKEPVKSAEETTMDKLKSIVLGQQVKTPQNETLKIKEIMGDKIMLEDVNGIGKIVEKTILEKWLKG